MKFQNKQINYLFYGPIFLLIAATTIVNILFLETIKPDCRSFFIVHCIGQSFLEVLLLILGANFIEKYLPKYFFYIFIGFTFLFFLTHLIDFILIKIMDLSFWNALGIVLDETFANFIEMLILTGVPLYAWGMIFLSASLIPILGIAIYKTSKSISEKKPFNVKNDYLLLTCFAVIFSLFIWDFSSSSAIRSDVYQAYQKALPWKTTFLSMKNKTITIDNHLIPSHTATINSLPIKNLPTLSKKPNIYIFVIESLRHDFISPNISPSLYDFKKAHVSFDLSLSNSNNTHCSWYSIFYSKYPFYWADLKKHNWNEGSIPLNILKQAGYKINVLTSSGLHYYKMDDLLFGKNNKLLHSIYLNNNRKETPAYKSDAIAIDKLIDHPSEEGNVFLVFIESTHFNYSWPPDLDIKFKPITDTISTCVTYTTKQQVNAIKNRYRNSLNYVDTLFGKFIKNLKEKNLYDDSIIVVTGDHGEEFFEKGHLFHASHLSLVQTNIPLYYKIGDDKREIPTDNLKLTSHIDIFPTILDYLFEGHTFPNLFDGESIFSQNKFPYVLSTRYNASRSPFEFFIHDGMKKITLKFKNRNIFKTKELEILSVRDLDDEIKQLPIGTEQDTLLDTKKALESAFFKKQEN